MGTCKPQRVLLTIFGLLAVAASAFAHHSFSAEFQTGKEFKVTGVMTKVDWINPHIHFFVDVKDDSGNVATWDFEGLPPKHAPQARTDQVYVQTRGSCYRDRRTLQRWLEEAGIWQELQISFRWARDHDVDGQRQL